MKNEYQEEVNKNYDFFKQNEDRWNALNPDKKHVLIKNQKEIGFYYTFKEAYYAARDKFACEPFSIQEIRPIPMRLNERFMVDRECSMESADDIVQKVSVLKGVGPFNERGIKSTRRGIGQDVIDQYEANPSRSARLKFAMAVNEYINYIYTMSGDIVDSKWGLVHKL